jgi:glycosyltransferase involved in cell wall biosynthesis
MRKWDYEAAQNPDFIIGISHHIQSAIKKYYKRESVVIHPPVETDRFSIPHEKHGIANVRKGFVITGRQTPYKRIDLAVQACTQLNVPLIVIGKGPEHVRLKKMAGKNITFLRRVSDTELPHYLQSAEAFLFPGIDDFGIAPVEAMASGTPVIAYKGGGALDYIIERRNGMFFEKQTVDDLVKALENFKPNSFNAIDVMTSAQAFSSDRFQKEITEFIAGCLARE